jgi:hypothetical protein
MISNSSVLLLIGGLYNLAFAVFHLFFWKIFRWREDLTSLTRVNRAIMQVLNLCLTFVFFVMAYISIVFRTELSGTELGRALSLSFAVFWFLRMIEQIIFFGLRHKVSSILTVMFLGGSLLYLIPALIGG